MDYTVHIGIPQQAASPSRLLRLAVTGEDLGRARHRVAEGGVETDAADLPAMIALGGETPIRAPAELLLDPVERADECGLAAGLLAEGTPALRVDLRQPIEANVRIRQQLRIRQHARHAALLRGRL